MGVKRVVDVDFWNDEKVMDMFTPEDKLFFLYLLTNPHTTQLGIYAINPKHISFELGYTVDSVNVLLDRFENKYDIIKYSHETKEIAVKNFLRHSIIKGGAPVRDCLVRELRAVKNKDLIGFVFAHIKYSENINETVKGVISDYEESNGEVDYCYDKRKSTKKKINEYDNVNENENDVSCNDTLNDSSNESLPKKKSKKSSYDDILSAISDDSLKELYLEYIKMRKMIKAPMTDRALKMLIKKVEELEPLDIDRQKRLLENAIMNNWKSVYPLKDERQQSNQRPNSYQKPEPKEDIFTQTLKKMYGENKETTVFDSNGNEVF